MSILNRTYVVTANALDKDGAGVGPGISSSESKTHPQAEVTVHVPGLLPFEKAYVTVQHQSPHTKELFAILSRRITSAPDRVSPACAQQGRCGSCVLMHLDYSAQLLVKKQWVSSALSKQNLPLLGPICDTVPASHLGLYGRRQAKYVVGKVDGQVVLGSYLPRSHQMLDMKECHLVLPSIREISKSMAGLIETLGISIYDENTFHGSLRYVILRASKSGAVQMTLVIFDEIPNESMQLLIKQICQAHPQIVSVISHQNQATGNAIFTKEGQESLLFGDPYLWEPIFSISARLSSRSFIQANAEVSLLMYDAVASALDPKVGDGLLDVYCGIGGIGFTAWQKQQDLRVLGIEENPAAIEDAKTTANAYELLGTHFQFFCQSAEDTNHVFLSTHALQQRKISLVVLNPPRKGASSQVIDLILALAPRRIAYVSCNPETLARDLSQFVNQKYQIKKVMPFDLHPHTNHIETVVILERLNENLSAAFDPEITSEVSKKLGKKPHVPK